MSESFSTVKGTDAFIISNFLMFLIFYKQIVCEKEMLILWSDPAATWQQKPGHEQLSDMVCSYLPRSPLPFLCHQSQGQEAFLAAFAL